MAVRQYIGARYVPKFDGVHDSTKAYEPLTIVTDVNEASSYTSKKFVPVGIELTNAEYWALTGTLSGAVLDLQNRMTSAENNISNIDNKLNTRKYILIGDSYTTVEGGAFPNTFANAMSLEAGTDFFFAGHGGAGFIGDGASNTFLHHLQSLESAIEDKNEITDIIVLGGVNDGPNTYADIYAAGTTFVQYAKSMYPKSKVHIGFISRSTQAGAIYNLYKNVLKAYKALSSAGAGFIEGSTGWLTYGQIGNDGIHPNVYGCSRLAWCLASWCISGTVGGFVEDEVTYPLVFDVPGITSTAGMSLNISRYTKDYNVELSQGLMSISGVTSSEFKFASCSQKLINMKDYNIGALHSTCQVRKTADSQWYTVGCDIKVTLNGIYLRVQPPYGTDISGINAILFTTSVDKTIPPELA